MLGCLGCRLGSTTLTLPHYRVRHNTRLQLADLQQQQQRLQRFAAFEKKAGITDAVATGNEIAHLLAAARQLPWEKERKELYWRLVLSPSPPHAWRRSTTLPDFHVGRLLVQGVFLKSKCHQPAGHISEWQADAAPARCGMQQRHPPA